MELIRVIKGFLIVPLVPGIIWAMLMQVPAVLVFAVPIAYLCAMFIGIPLFYLLHRFGRINFLTVTLSGVLSATLPPFLFMIARTGSFFELLSPSYVRGLLLFGLFGFLASTAFWFIAIKEKREMPRDMNN